MANEIFWSSISTDSGRALVRAEILGQLGDAMSLPMHPALINAGDVAGTNTDTVYQRADSLNGAATMSSLGESGNWDNTAYDTDRYSVGVTTKYLQMTRSDFANMVNDGQLDASRFAAHFVSARNMTMTNLIATVIGTLSNTGVNSASALTVADMYTSTYALEALYGVSRGRRMAVLHPKQAKELAVDAQFTQAQNAASRDPRYQVLRQLMSDSYVGYLPDIDTDVFKTFKVGNSGGKHLGGIISRGAVAYATGTPQEQASYARSVLFGDMLFAEERDPTGPRSAFRGVCNIGVAKWQECGVLVKSPT